MLKPVEDPALDLVPVIDFTPTSNPQLTSQSGCPKLDRQKPSSVRGESRGSGAPPPRARRVGGSGEHRAAGTAPTSGTSRGSRGPHQRSGTSRLRQKLSSQDART